jgi:hypothetical protein
MTRVGCQRNFFPSNYTKRKLLSRSPVESTASAAVLILLSWKTLITLDNLINRYKISGISIINISFKYNLKNK